MNERLKANFYHKSALHLAQDLLGKYLVRETRKGTKVGRIVETEAYLGEKDRAAHSFQGRRTERTKVLYLSGGRIYIYLVYGMYWQLNITAGGKNQPECVLIRALETEDNIKLTNGPGKLCRYLDLDKSFYGENLVTSLKIWLEDRHQVIRPNQIIATPRVGIDYAQEWKNKPLRFYLKNSIFVSQLKKSL